MDDADRLTGRRLQPVRVVQPEADLAHDLQAGADRRDAPLLGELCLHGEQRLALDVLHRDEEALVDLSELEDLNQVRVREQAAELRLVDEHLDERAVLREVREHPLDHQRALESLRPERDREEHLRHPSHADPIEQIVLPERLRSGERTRLTADLHGDHRRPISVRRATPSPIETRRCGSRSDPVAPRPPAAPGGHSSTRSTLQLVLSFELPPLIDRHVLLLIDFQVPSLEFQPVGTASNRQSDNGRLLSGVRAVDPEVGPGVRADRDATVRRGGPRLRMVDSRRCGRFQGRGRARASSGQRFSDRPPPRRPPPRERTPSPRPPGCRGVVRGGGRFAGRGRRSPVRARAREERPARRRPALARRRRRCRRGVTGRSGATAQCDRGTDDEKQARQRGEGTQAPSAPARHRQDRLGVGGPVTSDGSSAANSDVAHHRRFVVGERGRAHDGRLVLR